MRISYGIQQMILATFLFTLANALVKVVNHIPAIEIVVFRAVISLLVCWLTMKKQGIFPWGKPKNRKFLLMRGLFGSVGLILFFTVIQRLPLANALVIFYIAPIFTTILAYFWLGESFYKIQWLFFAITLAGVWVIKGFDPRVDTLSLVMGLVATLFSAGAYVTIRRLKNAENPWVIVFFFPLVTLPIAGAIASFYWITPVGWDWLILIAIGLLTQFAQVAMTKGYQQEEPSKAASITYSGVVYGLILGFILFNETFGWVVIGGMVLVIAGILLNVNARRVAGYLKRK